MEINNFNIVEKFNIVKPETFMNVCGEKGLRPSKIQKIGNIFSIVLQAFTQ